MKSINKRRKKRRKKKQSVFKSIKTFFKNIKRSFFDEVEEEISPKTTFSMTEVILIVLISILFGVILGYFITYSKSPIGTKANPKVSEMVNTYNNIINNYYDKVDQEKLGDAAIKGMMESLEDPYSNYMDGSTANDFNESIDGSFTGIGVMIQNGEDYRYDIHTAIAQGMPYGECKTCRHRDPEDKKCEHGGLERQGCLFPVGDDYFCKFYEKGGTLNG